MRHKDIEFRVIQGVERNTWLWSADIEGLGMKGRIARIQRQGVEITKEKAIARAVSAIDRALAGPKRVVRRPGNVEA